MGKAYCERHATAYDADTGCEDCKARFEDSAPDFAAAMKAWWGTLDADMQRAITGIPDRPLLTPRADAACDYRDLPVQYAKRFPIEKVHAMRWNGIMDWEDQSDD